MIHKNDRNLIETATNVINENYYNVNWWHTVGAAVGAKPGKLYVGVNCDCVSYGSCVEVIAIESAVSVGEKNR